MLKKFTTIGITFAVLLAMTTPAFAAGNKKNDQPHNKPTNAEVQPQQTKKQKRDAALAARKAAETAYIAAIKAVNDQYASDITEVKNSNDKTKIASLKAARIKRDNATKLAKNVYKTALASITLQN